MTLVPSEVSTFSGADVLVVIDGKVINAIQEIKWKKELTTSDYFSIEGTIKAVLFGEKNPLEEMSTKPFDIQLLYLNESGYSKAYVIEYVKITEISSGVAVDSVLEEAVYTFKAKEIIVFPQYKHSLAEQINFIRTHRDTKEEDIKKLIALYESNILRRIKSGEWVALTCKELNDLEKEAVEQQAQKGE